MATVLGVVGNLYTVKFDMEVHQYNIAKGEIVKNIPKSLIRKQFDFKKLSLET